MTAAAATSTVTSVSVNRRASRTVPPPAPTTSATIRIHCHVVCSIRYHHDGRIREKKRCDSIPVFRVFTPAPLDMCNVHFNEYFESHEIAVDMVMRLSDNEDDFVAGNYKASRFNKRSDRADVDVDDPDEPICQVPKPRMRAKR